MPSLSRLALGLILVLLIPLAGLRAQDTGLVLTLDDQQNLADLRCPEAAALQPAGAVWWVLLVSCGLHVPTLAAYDPSTGAPLDESVVSEIALDTLDLPGYELDRFINALGFAPDGRLELVLSNYDSDLFSRVWIDVAAGRVTQDADADAALNTLVRQYTTYPTFLTVFSDNRQMAAVSDEVDLRVLDLVNESVLLEIPGAGIGISAFSADGQSLYVTTPNEPDNFDNWDSTLSVYRLPEGDLLETWPIPFGTVYPSPDGRYVAFEAASNEGGDEQLGVMSLETGAQSNLLPIGEAPRRLLTCVNDGRDVSDVDFTVSGRQSLQALLWRPDGSGFMTLHSPGFQGTNTGCQFDVGRVRQYSVESN